MKYIITVILVSALLFCGCASKSTAGETFAELDEVTFSAEPTVHPKMSAVPLYEQTPPPTKEATPTPEPTPVPTVAVTPKPTAKPTPKVTVTKSPSKYNSNLNIDDNVFLDALEYTGYNLQKHRDDGNMWVFIHGKYKKGLGYLSQMGYSDATSGYETNEHGDPDIARIVSKGGLVCASYVTYVYFNYLPNVAGIDTSSLPRPENSRSAQSWRKCAEKWVEMGLSREISFKAYLNADGSGYFEPDEDIPIGSIMVYKVAGASDSANARHVGIYAGCKGGYHWMTHVGNDRGPEMITVERMGYSSTREIVLKVITPPIEFASN